MKDKFLPIKYSFSEQALEPKWDAVCDSWSNHILIYLFIVPKKYLIWGRTTSWLIPQTINLKMLRQGTKWISLPDEVHRHCPFYILEGNVTESFQIQTPCHFPLLLRPHTKELIVKGKPLPSHNIHTNSQVRKLIQFWKQEIFLVYDVL